MERIADDMERDAIDLSIKVDRWLVNTERLIAFDRYLSQGDQGGLSEWQLYVGFFTRAGWSPFAPNRTTYDELISSGHFRLIRDADLRREIAEYYQTLRESATFYRFDPPTRALVRQAYSPEAQTYIWRACFSTESYRLTAGGEVDCVAGVEEIEVMATLRKLRETEGLVEAFRFSNSMLQVNIGVGRTDAARAAELATKLRAAKSR
jgi:hypothetical protein